MLNVLHDIYDAQGDQRGNRSVEPEIFHPNVGQVFDLYGSLEGRREKQDGDDCPASFWLEPSHLAILLAYSFA